MKHGPRAASAETRRDEVGLLDLVREARALVFDFDGTLVDSNEIKWRAFEHCFADFPGQLPEIIAYCRRTPHIPRGDKFRFIYETILRVPYTRHVERRLHDQFNRMTIRQVIEAPEIVGAAKFLAQAAPRYTTAVLSSTPHEVLSQIVAARGWQRYFSVVQGAPVHKAGWLAAYRQAEGLDGGGVIYFGDSEEDLRAARAGGCVFVGVVNPALTGRGGYVIPDFTVFDFDEMFK